MVGSAPLPVFAQRGEPATQPAEGEQDPAALFELADQYYRDGRYEEAAEILSQLAETIPDPVLLYNLGRAYESAGELESAVDAYERYLEAAPNAKDADAVTARVGRLRERVAEEQAEAEDDPPPEPPPPVVQSEPPTPAVERSPGARAAPWIVLGVGGATAATGLALALVASSKNRDARDEPVQSKAVSLDDDAQRFALVGNITMAVGGALAIAGLTWGLVRLGREKKRRRVAWAPGGVRF